MSIYNQGFGGGMNPSITVTTTAGATVTVALGTKSVTAIATGGTAKISVWDYGSYSVHAALGDAVGDVTVNVIAVQDYAVTVETVVPIPTVLNNATWAQIKEVAEKSQGPNYWSVGDTKQITINGKLSDGLTLSNYNTWVYIIGFDHNSAVEGTGIAFGGFKTAQTGGVDVALCDSAYGNDKTSGQWFNMNNSETNSGGWASCRMRSTTLPLVKSALPSELKAVIKTTTIYSDNTGGGSNMAYYVTAPHDDLYLLAEFEIFGARSYANSAERDYQQQYAYYVAGNSKVKYRHDSTATAVRWRERSVGAADASFFCYVFTNGAADRGNASYSFGLAVAFKVGSNHILSLYNEGNECTDVTGGWITGKLDQVTYPVTPIDGIKQEDSLKVSMPYGTGNKYSGFRTTNSIDWASYRWINIEFSYQITQTGDSENMPVFQLSLQNNAMSTDLELNSGSVVAARSGWAGKGDTKIGIPNSVGTYSHRASAKLPPVNLQYDIPTSPSYFLALIGWWWSGNSAAANVTIKKIWLE